MVRNEITVAPFPRARLLYLGIGQLECFYYKCVLIAFTATRPIMTFSFYRVLDEDFKGFRYTHALRAG